MKLDVDPLPTLKERAEAAINRHFNLIAGESLQRDAEHACKRRAASSGRAEAMPKWFRDAAEIEGVTVGGLMQTVLFKPEEAAERGLARRRGILRVRRAATAAEVEAALADLGIEQSLRSED